MSRVREAKLSDLRGIEGRENLLGGPTYSLSALETFMTAPEFVVLVARDSALVLYHEGPGGKSRMLLLVGNSPEMLRAADASARSAGTVKIALEVDPGAGSVPVLAAAGYRKKGEVANYFGKDRPAVFMEKRL